MGSSERGHGPDAGGRKAQSSGPERVGPQEKDE